MEFEKAFSRPGKGMDLGENGRGCGKVVEFHFLSKYFMLFENWKHSPSHCSKYVPKKVWFSACFSHGRFKLVMEKSLIFIAQFEFLCEPWYNFVACVTDADI